MTRLILIFIVLLGSLFIITSQVKAQDCAKVISVTTLGPQPLALNQPFTCIVTVENPTTRQRKDIACGIGVNGEFPNNYCPSHNDSGHNFFGGWRGDQAYFNCVMPYTDEIINATSLELVGDDFSEGCKQQTRIAIPLTIQGPVQNSPNESNKVAGDAVKFVEELLRIFGAPPEETSDTSTTSSTNRTPPTTPRENESTGTLRTCNISSRTPVEGPPTITVEKMRQVLQSAHSPAIDDTQAIYDLGIKYNINPAVLLAFFIKESSAGTAGSAVTNKSIGNIVCTSGYQCGGRFRMYNTWVEGAEDYYKLLRNLYINTWGLYYVETVIPVYAPTFENDTCLYIAQTVQRINSWK